MVLLHGWGAHSAIWQPIIEPLSKRADLTLIDLPGFGFSDMIEDYSLDAVVSDVLSKAPESAIWLGWSLGGLIATQAALTHPNRVQQLMTVCSSPCFEAHDDWSGMSPELLHKFSTQLSDDYRQTMRRFLALQFFGLKPDRQLLRALEEKLFTPEPNPAALKGGLDLLKDTDLRQALPDLQCPMTAFFGKLDAMVPVDCAKKMKTLNPDINTIVFEKGSHAPFLSHVEEFLGKIDLTK